MTGKTTQREPLVERTRIDFHLSVKAQRLIVILAKDLGVGKSHIIELSVREMAEKRGVK